MSEPFDEQAFLQILDRADELSGTPTQLTHQARKLVTEVIRLRNEARVSRERLALLEQGQTLLALPLSTATNHQPHHVQN